MAPNIRVTEEGDAKLKRLAKAIRGDWGIPADKQSVLAALIHEVTVGQAAGMLMAYTKHLEESEPSEPDD
jgi:hypothetical protein